MTDTLVDKIEIIEESGTVVDRLKAIEKIPSYVKIDKKAAYREVFEIEREKNDLLDRVIREDINLLQEYEAFVKEFARGRNYYPHYHSSEEYRKRFDDLVSILGYFGIGDGSNLIANPILIGGVGTVASGIGAISGQRSVKKSHEINRREFLRNLLPGALLAIGVGNASSFVKLVCRYVGIENASYVQTKIREVYHT